MKLVLRAECFPISVYVGGATVGAAAWWFMVYEEGPKLNYYQLVWLLNSILQYSPFITHRLGNNMPMLWLPNLFNMEFGQRNGSVVECLTQDRLATGSSLTGVTVLCP